MDKTARKRRHAEYMRAWRAANPHHADYQREYQRRYLSDPDKRREAVVRARAWAIDNPQRRREIAAAWNARQPKKGRKKGAPHHRWKGDAASYSALHSWVVRERGRPSECSICGTTTVKRFEWCNIDHQYRRDLKDWFRACTSCHRRHDYEKKLPSAARRKRR